MPARLKLNLFSPLPPLRTEIANVSAIVLRELAALADVTAWTPQESWDPALARDVEVRRFDPDALPIRALNRADASFYNLGNDARFHRGIFDAARRGAPGVVILHDTRLQHFFAAASETEGAGRDEYLAAMRRVHGAEAEADARRRLAGELSIDALVDRWPMTPAAIEPALAAVVHNRAELPALRGRVQVPLYDVPLPAAFDIGPRPPARPQRGADDPIRLVMFGFIGTNRCLPEVLRALAAEPGRTNCVLDIFGALEQPGPADVLIAQHGLQDRVRRHGFVEEAVLSAALARADLAFNLRNPTMGEASASQLRIWANLLPSLVSRVGWYATLPAGTAFPVEPGREVEEITRHLAALRRDPAPYREAGLRGREVLEREHRPRQYAEALLRIAAEVPALHVRRQAARMAERGSAALLDMMSGAQAASLVPTVADSIRDLVVPPDR